MVPIRNFSDVWFLVGSKFSWDKSFTLLEAPIDSVTSAATSMLVTDVGDEMC